MSTSTRHGLANPHIVDRAAAYSIPAAQADGNDLPAVRQAAADALAHARNGHGPFLLECRTYRLSGHSRGDKREYRHAHEESEAWQREPITRLEKHLRDLRLADDEAIAAHHAAARIQIEEAIRFAEQSPLPDVSTVTEGVYA